MLRCRLELLADIGQQAHEPGPFDGCGDGPLVSGTEAAPFTAEQLALTGDQLFQVGNVLEIDERGARAALFSAESAAVFPAFQRLFGNHDSTASNLSN